jgi:NAD(P)-dependent dehydrogenase (short-subunit alcohol dehydrogenase family)
MKKSILITGANGGIGKALCQIFNDNEYFVIATDCHQESKCKCDAYIQMELEQYAVSEIKRKNLIEIVEKIDCSYPFIGLINNAGYQILKKIDDILINDVFKTYAINLYSPIFIIQDLIPVLTKNKGSIINISSIHAGLTKAKFSIYASSKAALSAFTRSLAIEVGEHVRVNAIEPGAIETDMLKDGFKEKPSKLEMLKSYQPVKRIGKVEEVARLALNMINDYYYMNGACIRIDGGIGACLHDPD